MGMLDDQAFHFCVGSCLVCCFVLFSVLFSCFVFLRYFLCICFSVCTQPLRMQVWYLGKQKKGVITQVEIALLYSSPFLSSQEMDTTPISSEERPAATSK